MLRGGAVFLRPGPIADDQKRRPSQIFIKRFRLPSAGTPRMTMDTLAHPASTLPLAEVLDLKAASALATDLLALRGADVALDGSAVQRLGAQCLQVIMSARATWDKEGASLQIVNPSRDLIEGLELLGADPVRYCAKEAHL
jgi:chemotaxis protein CheX